MAQIYQFTGLPFGVSCAPRAFARWIRPVKAFLRSLGINLNQYSDDWLIWSPSRQTARLHAWIVFSTLRLLGFHLNPDKCILEPTQRIEYLGWLWDSTTGRMSITDKRLRKIRHVIATILPRRAATRKQLESLLGSFQYQHQSTQDQWILLRHLRHALWRAKSGRRTRLPAPLIGILSHWSTAEASQLGCLIQRPLGTRAVEVETDASSWGTGGRILD